MSISENIGGLSTYLSQIRAGENYIGMKKGVKRSLKKNPVLGDKVIKNVKKLKSSIKQLLVPGMLFEDMNITYLGPIDGHNISMMRKIIMEAKNIDKPVIIHVCTKKEKDINRRRTTPMFSTESGRLTQKRVK